MTGKWKTKRGFVYLMASKRNGTLYLGVTCDLIRGCHQHRNELIDGFSKKYGCHMLVWYEAHDDLQDARLRELQMKKWKRGWKVRFIQDSKP